MLEKKQKQEKKGIQEFDWKKFTKTPKFNFGLAAFFFILLIGLLAFPKYSEFVKKKADLKKIFAEIEGDNASGQFFGLKGELKKVEAEYKETKQNVDNLNAEKQATLDFVFPEAEKINFITQLLERYAIDHDTSQEPFELTSISFAKPRTQTNTKPKPGEKPKVPTPVAYLPVQINLPIKASEKNFEDFIQFIQRSGSLEQDDFYGKEIPVPLMTIESLNFTYSENPERLSQQLVNANFILNTYIHLDNKNVSTTK